MNYHANEQTCEAHMHRQTARKYHITAPNGNRGITLCLHINSNIQATSRLSVNPNDVYCRLFHNTHTTCFAKENNKYTSSMQHVIRKAYVQNYISTDIFFNALYTD